MDTLSFCRPTDFILPDTYIASIDLRDAYNYSVPVAAEFQEYLKYQLEGVLYLTCLPNGLASAPRDLTKFAQACVCLLRLSRTMSRVVILMIFFLQGILSVNVRQI